MIKKIIYIAFILGAAIVSSGCFVYNPSAEFVKQRYINTVAYFNTFYNAQRAFSEAEEEVLQARKEYSSRPPGDKPFTAPPSARTKFTASIEKNSKLLSFYPNSKWVDDALMMIGKAYYYIDDNVKAERKFLELLAKYPESEFTNEANLLLGIGYLRQKKIDQGIKKLEGLFDATVEDDEEIAGKASFELGEYYYSQNSFDLAEKYYSQALPLISDEAQQAFAQYQIGLCYNNLEQYTKAEEAFARVDDFESEYNLQFRAMLARLKAMVLQKKFTEALDAFTAMLDDTKNSDFYGTIHLEIANTLSAQGRMAEAMEEYHFVDTSYARTEESARSYFALAKIYEDSLKNYDSARVYYNKAKAEFAASKITPTAALKAEIFNKYDNLTKDLIRFDTLLFNTLNQKIEEDTAQIFMSDSLSVGDSTGIAKNGSEQRKATKPGKKLEAKKDSALAVDSTKIKIQLDKELAKKQLIDSLQRSIARTKFELGGLFFLEMQIPDSALYWLQDVARNYPQNELTPRALFTIGEIYRTLPIHSQSERDSIYWSIITNYPNSPYAQEARKNLGLTLVKIEPDSAAILFEQAEAQSEERHYTEAIDTYNQIAEKYSDSPITPKALYAMGWHLENSVVNNDSALAVYKRLLGKYPSSLYASAVRLKVTEYDNEQKRIEDEKKKQIEEQKIKEQKEKEQKEKEQKGANQKEESSKADSLDIPKIHLPKADSTSTPKREL